MRRANSAKGEGGAELERGAGRCTGGLVQEDSTLCWTLCTKMASTIHVAHGTQDVFNEESMIGTLWLCGYAKGELQEKAINYLTI